MLSRARHRVLSIATAALAVGLVSSGLAAPAAAGERDRDIRLLRATVNGGRPVVVGPHEPVDYQLVQRYHEPSGIKGFDYIHTFNNRSGRGYSVVRSGGCRMVSSDVARCTHRLRIIQRYLAGYHDGSANRMAGEWTVSLAAQANDGDRYDDSLVALFPVLREVRAEMQTDTPRSVARDARVRFQGRLWHADWERQRWMPFRGTEVVLEYKRRGTAGFDVVSRVTTTPQGRVSAAVTVPGPGEYRWRFVGDQRNARDASAPVTVSTY